MTLAITMVTNCIQPTKRYVIVNTCFCLYFKDMLLTDIFLGNTLSYDKVRWSVYINGLLK